MDKHTNLRQIVATLCRVEPEAVGPDFSVAPLVSGSLTVHRLEAAVREHLGVVPPRLHGLRTYAELEAAVLGGAGQRTEPARVASKAVQDSPQHSKPQPQSEKGRGLACGLDVEPIANFPAAPDYWLDEFYANTFTGLEIAYCARQPDPRPHFAARWCAKEALKKCDPAYLAEQLLKIQVRHDEHGAPVLQRVGTQQILPYAVSLTHSEDLAAAVVIRLDLASTSAALEPKPPAPAVEVGAATATGKQQAWRTSTVALVFALLGVLISSFALWRSIGF
jgi:holo-[acyl-carrier protein] synthase